MEKNKIYPRTRFPASVIEDAHNLFLSKLDTSEDVGHPSTLTTSIANETWNFDTKEEFLAEYPKAESYYFDHISQGNRLIISDAFPNSVSVVVRFPNRPLIESVFQVFERNLDKSRLPEPPKPELPTRVRAPLKVFIGHGHDLQWRDLKDHLREKHGIDVTAYEIGPRAGLSVKEVLQRMLHESSFALLVLTGEDIHTDGELHARENVIHELGLFQGSLGFEKAIVLLEDSVREFSNILGINQIRFSKGAIRETFGDILAVIKREFEEE
jgi:predicted nucleotide-binding protein